MGGNVGFRRMSSGVRKTFDCVQMKREASLRIYRETKDLSFEQNADYWRRKREEALRRYSKRSRA